MRPTTFFFLRPVTFLLFAVLLGLSGRALAAVQYYSASVPVSSQATAERNRAAGIGLKEVLVRLAGREDVASAPGVLQTLSEAQQYLEQFDYAQGKDEAGQPVQILNMTFTPSLVQKTLQDAGLPFWPLNRPQVLLWLVVDDPEEGRTLINQADHEAVLAISEAARVRGLPLVRPLLDLEDQFALHAGQVWDLNEDAILNASERYRVETVLVGRLAQTSGGTWLSTWEFFHQGETRLYDGRAQGMPELAAQGVYPLADYLAQRYAVNASVDSSTRMYALMEDVRDFADYRGMATYLQQLAMMNQVSVVSINGNQVLVSFQLNGTIKQLHNAFSLDGRVRAEQRETQDQWQMPVLGTRSSPLRLFWLGRAG